MADQMSLDDVLNEKPEKPPVVEKEAPVRETTDNVGEPAPEKAEVERAKSLRSEHRKKELAAQGRDPETGKFTPKDEVEAKPPEKAAEPAKAPEKPAAQAQSEMTEKERGFLRAAEGERRKRQELERKLTEMQARLPAGDPEKPKGFWDDPEAGLKSHEERMRQIQTETRLNTAEMIARSKYTDFDEKIAKFTELVQQTPGLAAQWLAAQDPAEFAYKLGKNHMDLQQAGSLDKLRADIETKVRAEERAKVEAEYKAKAEAADKQRSALPGTLSDVRGAASQHKEVWGGPTPLSDVLGRND